MNVVSVKHAKQLKVLGFNQKCDLYYEPVYNVIQLDMDSKLYNSNVDNILAPTNEEAIDFLLKIINRYESSEKK